MSNNNNTNRLPQIIEDNTVTAYYISKKQIIAEKKNTKQADSYKSGKKIVQFPTGPWEKSADSY